MKKAKTKRRYRAIKDPLRLLRVIDSKTKTIRYAATVCEAMAIAHRWFEEVHALQELEIVARSGKVLHRIPREPFPEGKP